jgi:23S rRNA (guanosine2251-2'-O)-methyltransferase
MAVAEVTNLVNTIEELKKQEYWIVGLDATGDKVYTEIDYKSPIAIVVGNEGKGIRRLVREHCDFLVRIPVRGKIASLNASVAGAIVMYEAIKQRLAS